MISSSPFLRARGAVLLSLVVAAAIAVAGSRSGSAPAHAAGGLVVEELIVVLPPHTAGSLARRVHDEALPSWRQAAAALDLPLREVQAAQGAPAEVHLAPLLIYQDARGRSIFQGRFTDVSKLEHFVRTRRVLEPSGGLAEWNDLPAMEIGRARIATPLKITPLAGEAPAGFDANAFATEARAALLDGFDRLSWRERIDLGPSDRLFYLDFHPHRSAAGTLSVSIAVFSQFHCLDPVFQEFDAPISGPWSQRREVFARAAARLEDEVLAQIRSSERGDGFVALPSDAPAPSWESLGLELPAERPAAERVQVADDLELPRSWEIRPPSPGEPPRLTFRFPAPLERYTGEVAELSGRLELDAGESDRLPPIESARGWIEAATATVTMGDSALDAAIRSKMIRSDRFPAARFELGGVRAGAAALAWGQTSQLVADGTFRMVGEPVPIEVRAELEPVLGDRGEPLLRVRASFDLRLAEPFGIDGPDGPAPARDTLLFHLDFVMQEAS
ncbi:MAG: YceI family protein [Acidobacteriota bacterium]